MSTINLTFLTRRLARAIAEKRRTTIEEILEEAIVSMYTDELLKNGVTEIDVKEQTPKPRTKPWSNTKIKINGHLRFALRQLTFMLRSGRSMHDDGVKGSRLSRILFDLYRASLLTWTGEHGYSLIVNPTIRQVADAIGRKIVKPEDENLTIQDLKNVL